MSAGPDVSAAGGALAPRMWPRFRVRRESGLYAYEHALSRAGLIPVAGADEAGRGACAGPLVVAAVVLRQGRRGEVPGDDRVPSRTLARLWSGEDDGMVPDDEPVLNDGAVLDDGSVLTEEAMAR